MICCLQGVAVLDWKQLQVDRSPALVKDPEIVRAKLFATLSNLQCHSGPLRNLDALTNVAWGIDDRAASLSELWNFRWAATDHLLRSSQRNGVGYRFGDGDYKFVSVFFVVNGDGTYLARDSHASW